MSTQGVSLNLNGRVLEFKNAQDIDAALLAKKITQEQAIALKVLFPEQGHDFGKGVTIQFGNDQALTSEQKEAKDKAKAQQEAEVAQMKAQAAAASKEDKVAQVKQDGVTTQEGVITSHGDGTAYTFDIKAPGKEQTKTTKAKEQERMARYYDEKTGKWIEVSGDKTIKDVRAELKDKRQELKADKKQAKKDLKATNKELEKANEQLVELRAKVAKGEASKADLERAEARVKELTKKSGELAAQRDEAAEEYTQVRQAHKASKGRGIGGDTRAYNRNVKANNRLVNREVYFTDAEAEAAKKDPANKDKTIKVATTEDLMVLQQLSATAQRHMSEASSPNEKALWQELAGIFKDENGNDIPLDKVDTRKVQDALIDLTGGDMRLNYTEQQIISKETGMSMSQVRHAFKTYGFEAPHPIGKRIVNGLVAAAPVAASMGLSYILTKNKAGAEAHAESIAEDHAVADAHQTTVVSGEVTATAHAEASVPGYKFDWTNPLTGEELHKRVAGQFAEDTQSVTQYYEAVAQANAHAEAHAKAFASATAACEAVATLTPAGLIAAPALAFLAGFAKRPAEISATQAGVNTQKMATYVDVFKKNKNKNIGNQIIQMAGQITGDKAVDRALIVAVLDHDIGSQNTTPTTRELRSALAHLDAIKAEVDKFKKLPPQEPQTPPQEPQTPPQGPQTPPQGPQTPPAPKKEYHADGNNTYTVERNDILANIVRAKYPGVNPMKAMQAIKEANGLKDIHSLRTGQVLELPEVDGVKPGDAKVKKHIGGKRIKYRPTRTDAQERGSVYEGKAHEGSHEGETVVDSYTGAGARERARKRAEELNNQQ